MSTATKKNLKTSTTVKKSTKMPIVDLSLFESDSDDDKRKILKPAAVKVQKFLDDMSKEEAESIVKSGGFRKLTDDMFDDMEKPKKNLKTSTTVKNNTKMPVKITTFESDDEIEDERNKDRQFVNKYFVPQFYEPERIRKYYDVDAKKEERRLQTHNILNKANDIAISMNNKAKEQNKIGNKPYKGRADDIKKLVKLWNEYKKIGPREFFPFSNEIEPYTKIGAVIGARSLDKYFE
jgi:hypothetical protein